MKTDIFKGHSVTQRGLVIKGEQSEIVIPLSQAERLLSAVQRATSEPPPQSNDERQRRNSLQRQMKYG